MSSGARISALGVFHDPTSAAQVEAAVAALAEVRGELEVEFLIADNSEGRARVPALGLRADTTVIANPSNEGYGRALARGAKIARGDYLLVINPDLRARPGALARLVEEAERHPEAAVFGPALLNPDGSRQHSARRFYRWRTVAIRRTPLKRWAGRFAENRSHLYQELDPGQAHEVDWVIGAAMFFRRADFEALGGFDPRYFLYFEDVDICLRAWRAGRTVRYVGASEFVHGHRRESASWLPNRLTFEHLKSMHRFRARHGGWAQRGSPEPGAPMVFVNQREGALGERARKFAEALGGSVLAKDALGVTRTSRALGSALEVIRWRPRHVHVIDVGAAGVLVEVAARLVRARVVLDTGDEHMALARRTARLAGPALELAGAIERLALALADRVVVRGRGHIAGLEARGYNGFHWLPDGVESDRFAPVAPHPWRAARGWSRHLVVASVASLHLDRRYRGTPGAELIEALSMAPTIRAAIVGDGEGRALLEERARALQVSERVAFLGQVEARALPAYLASFDVCLSTQTDDAVGHARTTGKLPLFMAAGRFVLASQVGEAGRVLPAAMLVPYHGEFDAAYPARLAARLCEIDGARAQLDEGAALPAIARELFDYRVLAPRVRALATETVDA